jgi:hypothetical protein
LRFIIASDSPPPPFRKVPDWVGGALGGRAQAEPEDRGHLPSWREKKRHAGSFFFWADSLSRERLMGYPALLDALDNAPRTDICG